MSLNIFFGSALAILFLLTCVNGLNFENAKDIPCFDLTNKTVPLDLNWVGKLKTLYYPMMSRMDLYKAAANLLQKDPKDISEASVYYDSCFTWNFHPNGSITARGFNGHSREYKTKVLSPNMEKFEFGPVTGKNYGYSGLKYTTMTDNSTFLVTPFCNADGQMTWGLGTVTPTIPESTIKLVLDHIESLGFKREYFTEVRYDRCNLETIDYTSDSSADNEIKYGTTTVSST